MLGLEWTFPDHISLSFTQLHVLNGGKLSAKLSLMFNCSSYASPKEELICGDDDDDDAEDDR